MKVVKINIKLLSDTHLGSGQGLGSIVDSDIIYDDFGLPYFPARRLKGLLRNSSQEVVEMLEASGHPLFTKEDIDIVFGKPGSAEKDTLIVDDLLIPDYDLTVDWLKYSFKNHPEIFSPNKVIENLTNVRTQIQIDDRTGVAKDGSLRTIRVLNKGITFEGELKVPSKRAIHLLALASRNLKRVGTSRNRGLGLVDCSIYHKGTKLSDQVMKELFKNV